MPLSTTPSPVTKAIVPVAGLGTRLLPATKSMPKEMLPVGRKPAVQYVVEELQAAGLHQILMVTGRRKRSIEDHFDPDPDLVTSLKQAGKFGPVQRSVHPAQITHLLAGTHPGSKLSKAKKLGIPIVSEAEFLDLTGTK